MIISNKIKINNIGYKLDLDSFGFNKYFEFLLYFGYIWG